MATRLDRLFVLLESGSSDVTRQAAAKQLGEVIRIHPHELPVILSRLLRCIRSSSWETRVAAGYAVSAIAKSVPTSGVTIPNGEAPEDVKPNVDAFPRLSTTTFDVSSVLGSNLLLMASQGSEYNVDANRVSGEKQQSIIRKKLGLDFAEQIGMDTSEIVSSADLSVSHESKTAPETSSLVLAQLGIAQPAKKRKLSVDDDPGRTLSKSSSLDEDSEDVVCYPDRWPFLHFARIMCTYLFSPRWETRHGSATVLRELIRVHGSSPSLKTDWFEDVSLRLICVLMLDRFGDFVSDQVVAPVREAVAQALGVAVKFLDSSTILNLVAVLVELTSKAEWQVRHGALLGLKYVIAVREDLLDAIVPKIYDELFLRLDDAVDDVAAAAAAALVPAANVVVNVMPERVPQLLSSLWDSLLNLDELTSATSNVMCLLSKMLAKRVSNAESKNSDLKELIPRLWPFLGHSSAAVRGSALEALQMVVQNQSKPGRGADWLHAVLPVLMGQVFYRALVETTVDLHETIVRVWEVIILHADPSVLVAVASAAITGWLALLMPQSHTHLDLGLLGHGCKINRESPICLGAGDSTCTEGEREEACTRARLLGVRMLGFLSGELAIWRR